MSTESFYIVVVGDLEIVGCSLFKFLVLNSSPQFSEGRQSRSPHPHNEMFIFWVMPLDLVAVGSSFELRADIIRPGNIFFIDRNLDT